MRDGRGELTLMARSEKIHQSLSVVGGDHVFGVLGGTHADLYHSGHCIYAREYLRDLRFAVLVDLDPKVQKVSLPSLSCSLSLVVW